jgi:hypothetical protein
LWTLTALLVAFTFLFRWAYPTANDLAAAIVNAAFLILFVASFSTVGALISARRPQNAVGWIFCATGLLAVVAVFTADYAEYGLVIEPSTLPYVRTAAWVQNWIWPLVLCPAALFVLLFPDGRPPSPRWRPVAWLFAVAIAGWAVSQALVPGRLVNADYADAINPFGIGPLGPVFRALGAVSGVLLLATSVASAASVVVRFHRSRGTERRQLKWVAYASAMMMLVILAELAVETVAPETDALVNVTNLTLSAALTGVPIAAGIAILRHGLYDIDLLINRTLVYGFLTAMLAVVYLAGVVLMQYAFRALTGGDSQLAVVASTLAIAALFNPLRRRVQTFVDRRFYRSKYDAAKTLEGFSARLREETDLDDLSRGLSALVRETVAPEHVSLWLRTVDGGKRERG